MKKGISIWSFTDRTPEVCFALAKKYGFDGVEVGIGYEGPLRYDSTPEEIAEYKRKGESCGLAFYSLVCDDCWQYSLTADDPAERGAAKQMVRRQIEVAALLGCETVLVLPGMVQGLGDAGPVVDYEVAYHRAADALRELAPFAEAHGVVIGLENVWNKFLLSPLEVRGLIDSIGSAYVKAYFDVGNVLRSGFPEQWIGILGSRISKVHFKDFRRSVGTLDGFIDILDGDVDYPAVMAALRGIGYDGWVTAEVFATDGDVEGLLARNSQAMNKIFA